jgi:hypothetical protein
MRIRESGVLRSLVQLRLAILLLLLRPAASVAQARDIVARGLIRSLQQRGITV